LLLKRAYSNGILALARNYIIYITKEDFLLAFKAAYNKAFIENNIYIDFRGARYYGSGHELEYNVLNRVVIEEGYVRVTMRV
jgi:hypothetical protein